MHVNLATPLQPAKHVALQDAGIESFSGYCAILGFYNSFRYLCLLLRLLLFAPLRRSTRIALLERLRVATV